MLERGDRLEPFDKHVVRRPFATGIGHRGQRKVVALDLVVQVEQLRDERRQPADLELVERALLERLSHELPLLGLVEQGGGLLQPEQQRVLVDDRGCEGVVGLDGDLVRIEVGAVAELRQHAAAHLLRGLDGEGEAQDLARSRAAFDQRDDRAT